MKLSLFSILLILAVDAGASEMKLKDTRGISSLEAPKKEKKESSYITRLRANLQRSTGHNRF